MRINPIYISAGFGLMTLGKAAGFIGALTLGGVNGLTIPPELIWGKLVKFSERKNNQVFVPDANEEINIVFPKLSHISRMSLKGRTGYFHRAGLDVGNRLNFAGEKLFAKGISVDFLSVNKINRKITSIVAYPATAIGSVSGAAISSITIAGLGVVAGTIAVTAGPIFWLYCYFK